MPSASSVAKSSVAKKPAVPRNFKPPLFAGPERYFEGRAAPNLPGAEVLGVSLGCLGFFFSFRRSLFPMVISRFVFRVSAHPESNSPRILRGKARFCKRAVQIPAQLATKIALTLLVCGKGSQNGARCRNPCGGRFWRLCNRKLDPRVRKFAWSLLKWLAKLAGITAPTSRPTSDVVLEWKRWYVLLENGTGGKNLTDGIGEF